MPQWEFCEGAIAALLCTRRLVLPDEVLPVLLGTGDSQPGVTSGEEGDTWFADAGADAQFMALWTRRWNEVSAALAAEVESLDDERAYHPEVMDVRGAVCGPARGRARRAGRARSCPRLRRSGRWASCSWSRTGPKNGPSRATRKRPRWLNDALDAIVALTEDDTGKPTVCMHDEDGPPSVSDERLNAFGAAIWAVYDLRQLWQSLGPRVEPARKAAEPGRNDPCPCGSGKKYKKCHGA